ncbi:hypothetical protein HWD03_gp109 [Alteromonas phage vB_AmeM_PT11-V22]|uniref:Uncharacterized protein n=1 Tax=Alteromonas phage vB_AmeM_PT11-V22 TaxID=2704031 RepID=A0A6C0R0T9_9CAUD|nr:hypothetical protein HWD03_gp109 [Alteromonas phage vB_AmeM_PT11-V22]QHZ59788.1 hypothetical protein [Alteromonas phage vB_AmeM_PT11-V22]
MSNSQLFKEAHRVARNTVEQVGDYQIAFTLALRELIAEQRKPKETFILNKGFEGEIILMLLVFACMIVAAVVGVTVSPFHMVAVLIVGIMGSFVITGIMWAGYMIHVYFMKSLYNVTFETCYEVWLQAK